jgi:hypothetical protein
MQPAFLSICILQLSFFNRKNTLYRHSLPICDSFKKITFLQGWQRKLDPDYNVMKTLQTLLFKEDWAKSLQYTIQGLMAP